MSNIFDLQKRQEAVKFVLEKRAIKQAPVMRVGAAMDVSGSAQHLFTRGVMQATIDRLVPVAMRFDDNGEMDVWCFDVESHQLPTVGKQDYDGYIQREILGNRELQRKIWNGTKYAGVMGDMANFYFGVPSVAKAAGGFFGGLLGKKAPAAPAAAASTVPAMGLFITDGANNDRDAAARVLRDAQRKPIYWQLIGVGDPKEFGFLEEMADELPNVGFVHLASLELTDEQLYEKLLSDELCTFIKKL